MNTNFKPNQCLRWIAVLAGVVVLQADLSAASRELKSAFEAVRAVGPEGAGQAEAAKAWKVIAGQKPDRLLDVLGAMDGAGDLALNWLRPAAEAIADRAMESKKVPIAGLEKFALDTRHHPRARRLAWEIIHRADASKATAMLPKFLDDPGAELRREAVQQVIASAEAELVAGRKPAAVEGFKKALLFAREADQLDDMAKKLRGMGETVDLAGQFAWVREWQLIGPFDNIGGGGFAKAQGPEIAGVTATEFETTKGKAGWQAFSATDDYGIVNFNQPYGKLKGVTGYAVTRLVSTKEQEVEIRISSQNAWKVWLNGAELFGRDEYHRGREIDQYRIPAKLVAGDNTLVVKVAQNEQKEEWTQEWQFSLRLTDPTGKPVRLEMYKRADAR